MAMSQFVPELRLGYLYTYWGPLVLNIVKKFKLINTYLDLCMLKIFVLAVTLFREGVDDIRRWQRDEEVNSQKYKRLIRGKDHNIGTEYVSSSKLKVGDMVIFFLLLLIKYS